LRRVKELDPLARLGWRRVLLDGGAQHPVQRRRRDALLALLHHEQCAFHHLRHALVELGGDEDCRDVRHEIERFRRRRAVLLHRLAVFLDQVPLVDDQHHAARLIGDVAGDVKVLRCEPFGRVHDEQHDIGARDRPHRAEDAVLLDARLDLAPSADTRRVHQRDRLPFPFEFGVERIARRARLVADDGAFLTEECIEQARLADIRTTDNRDARSGRLRFFFPIWQGLDDRVEQIARAGSVQRGDDNRVGETKFVKIHGVRRAGIVFRLIRGEDDRLRGTAHHVRHGMIRTRRADIGVHDHHENIRFLDGMFGLFERVRRDCAQIEFRTAIIHDDATGIYEGE